MSSADSAGTEYGRGRGHGHVDSSCGLVGSLFSSGCRGRAEAFARRLHRRLTSLGNVDDSKNLSVASKPITREVASWLHAPSEALASSGNPIDRVFRRQPRHSPETELYYDFDADLDLEHEPSSPAEEVTAAELADLLVNTEILKNNHHDACHCSSNGPRLGIDQDYESECVFASPISKTPPESEASEIYFDPESSDVEKAKHEVYFDPMTTSESEATSNASNNVEDVPAKANLSLHDGQANRLQIYQEDSSDSSLSLSKSKPYERFRFDARCSKIAKEECSSEDSLNDRSSRETTSPSHESLWSTFDDDSTVSLRDETSRSSHDYLPPQKHFPKSHSDSEIPSNIGRVSAASTLPKTTERHEDEGSDVVDFLRSCASEELSQDPIKEQDSSSCDCSDDKATGNGTTKEVEPISENSPTDANEQLETDLEDSVANGGDHSTYTSTLSITDPLTVECRTGRRLTDKSQNSVKNEVTLRIENGTVLKVNDEEKMCLLLKELDRDRETALTTDNWNERANSKERDEEEEEEDRPRRVRRCSSLKTGKTPPGTPGRKKIVRFADVLGLDLADVRTFLDEIPKVPNSAYSDLIYDDNFQKEGSPANVCLASNWDNRYFDRRGSMATAPRAIDRTLVPLFQQPGGLPTFLDLIRERKVCLENVLVQDPVTLCIQGTVRVLNLDFHKSVHIRYTLNTWKNFTDLQATYISNSCDGFSDKFSFILYCHTLKVGQRLEFAVRFQCKGSQYWDNNDGANYCFQCLPVSSNVDYVPIRARENNRDWSPMFY